jgi:hypothetical protein
MPRPLPIFLHRQSNGCPIGSSVGKPFGCTFSWSVRISDRVAIFVTVKCTNSLAHNRTVFRSNCCPNERAYCNSDNLPNCDSHWSTDFRPKCITDWFPDRQLFWRSGRPAVQWH